MGVWGSRAGQGRAGLRADGGTGSARRRDVGGGGRRRGQRWSWRVAGQRSGFSVRRPRGEVVDGPGCPPQSAAHTHVLLLSAVAAGGGLSPPLRAQLLFSQLGSSPCCPTPTLPPCETPPHHPTPCPLPLPPLPAPPPPLRRTHTHSSRTSRRSPPCSSRAGSSSSLPSLACEAGSCRPCPSASCSPPQAASASSWPSSACRCVCIPLAMSAWPHSRLCMCMCMHACMCVRTPTSACVGGWSVNMHARAQAVTPARLRAHACIHTRAPTHKRVPQAPPPPSRPASWHRLPACLPALPFHKPSTYVPLPLPPSRPRTSSRLPRLPVGRRGPGPGDIRACHAGHAGRLQARGPHPHVLDQGRQLGA